MEWDWWSRMHGPSSASKRPVQGKWWSNLSDPKWSSPRWGGQWSRFGTLPVVDLDSVHVKTLEEIRREKELKKKQEQLYTDCSILQANNQVKRMRLGQIDFHKVEKHKDAEEKDFGTNAEGELSDIDGENLETSLNVPEKEPIQQHNDEDFSDMNREIVEHSPQDEVRASEVVLLDVANANANNMKLDERYHEDADDEMEFHCVIDSRGEEYANETNSSDERGGGKISRSDAKTRRNDEGCSEDGTQSCDVVLLENGLCGVETKNCDGEIVGFIASPELARTSGEGLSVLNENEDNLSPLRREDETDIEATSVEILATTEAPPIQDKHQSDNREPCELEVDSTTPEVVPVTFQDKTVAINAPKNKVRRKRKLRRHLWCRAKKKKVQEVKDVGCRKACEEIKDNLEKERPQEPFEKQADKEGHEKEQPAKKTEDDSLSLNTNAETAENSLTLSQNLNIEDDSSRLNQNQDASISEEVSLLEGSGKIAKVQTGKKSSQSSLPIKDQQMSSNSKARLRRKVPVSKTWNFRARPERSSRGGKRLNRQEQQEQVSIAESQTKVASRVAPSAIPGNEDIPVVNSFSSETTENKRPSTASRKTTTTINQTKTQEINTVGHSTSRADIDLQMPCEPPDKAEHQMEEASTRKKKAKESKMLRLQEDRSESDGVDDDMIKQKSLKRAYLQEDVGNLGRAIKKILQNSQRLHVHEDGSESDSAEVELQKDRAKEMKSRKAEKLWVQEDSFELGNVEDRVKKSRATKKKLTKPKTLQVQRESSDTNTAEEEMQIDRADELKLNKSKKLKGPEDSSKPSNAADHVKKNSSAKKKPRKPKMLQVQKETSDSDDVEKKVLKDGAKKIKLKKSVKLQVKKGKATKKKLKKPKTLQVQKESSETDSAEEKIKKDNEKESKPEKSKKLKAQENGSEPCRVKHRLKGSSKTKKTLGKSQTLYQKDSSDLTKSPMRSHLQNDKVNVGSARKKKLKNSQKLHIQEDSFESDSMAEEVLKDRTRDVQQGKSKKLKAQDDSSESGNMADRMKKSMATKKLKSKAIKKLRKLQVQKDSCESETTEDEKTTKFPNHKLPKRARLQEERATEVRAGKMALRKRKSVVSVCSQAMKRRRKLNLDEASPCKVNMISSLKKVKAKIKSRNCKLLGSLPEDKSTSPSEASPKSADKITQDVEITQAADSSRPPNIVNSTQDDKFAEILTNQPRLVLSKLDLEDSPPKSLATFKQLHHRAVQKRQKVKGRKLKMRKAQTFTENLDAAQQTWSRLGFTRPTQLAHGHSGYLALSKPCRILDGDQRAKAVQTRRQDDSAKYLKCSGEIVEAPEVAQTVEVTSSDGFSSLSSSLSSPEACSQVQQAVFSILPRAEQVPPCNSRIERTAGSEGMSQLTASETKMIEYELDNQVQILSDEYNLMGSMSDLDSSPSASAAKVVVSPVAASNCSDVSLTSLSSQSRDIEPCSSTQGANDLVVPEPMFLSEMTKNDNECPDLALVPLSDQLNLVLSPQELFTALNAAADGASDQECGTNVEHDVAASSDRTKKDSSSGREQGNSQALNIATEKPSPQCMSSPLDAMSEVTELQDGHNVAYCASSSKEMDSEQAEAYNAVLPSLASSMPTPPPSQDTQIRQPDQLLSSTEAVIGAHEGLSSSSTKKYGEGSTAAEQPSDTENGTNTAPADDSVDPAGDLSNLSLSGLGDDFSFPEEDCISLMCDSENFLSDLADELSEIDREIRESKKGTNCKSTPKRKLCPSEANTNAQTRKQKPLATVDWSEVAHYQPISSTLGAGDSSTEDMRRLINPSQPNTSPRYQIPRGYCFNFVLKGSCLRRQCRFLHARPDVNNNQPQPVVQMPVNETQAKCHEEQAVSPSKDGNGSPQPSSQDSDTDKSPAALFEATISIQRCTFWKETSRALIQLCLERPEVARSKPVVQELLNKLHKPPEMVGDKFRNFVAVFKRQLEENDDPCTSNLKRVLSRLGINCTILSCSYRLWQQAHCILACLHRGRFPYLQELTADVVVPHPQLELQGIKHVAEAWVPLAVHVCAEVGELDIAAELLQDTTLPKPVVSSTLNFGVFPVAQYHYKNLVHLTKLSADRLAFPQCLVFLKDLHQHIHPTQFKDVCDYALDKALTNHNEAYFTIYQEMEKDPTVLLGSANFRRLVSALWDSGLDHKQCCARRLHVAGLNHGIYPRFQASRLTHEATMLLDFKQAEVILTINLLLTDNHTRSIIASRGQTWTTPMVTISFSRQENEPSSMRDTRNNLQSVTRLISLYLGGLTPPIKWIKSTALLPTRPNILPTTYNLALDSIASWLRRNDA